MIILGIETSCDETAISLLAFDKNGRVKILAQAVSSQIKTHQKYGGVVPEVAARQHLANILPTISLALVKAKIKQEEISSIAVAAGPGLITSLMVGVETAKVLAYAWQKPVISLNHIEGHIYANLLANGKLAKIKFPALCLVVSGGHTELIYMKNHGDYQLVGRTLDDAAGEAFDKVAKLLNVGYPGGPVIEKLAKKGNPEAFDFPRPMINYNNYDFSFSGLKTSVLYLVKKDFKGKKIPLADLLASFQQAVVDVLTEKTIRATKELIVKTVMLAGGVAANQRLRQTLESKIKKLGNITFLKPNIAFCTDNAVMIALAGYFHALKKDFTPWQKLKADPNWELV
jgi:N6-L-threonylcarbamoyladenine synthase